MPFILQQPVRPETAPYVVFKDLFTKEECQKIIDLSKKLPAKEALIGSDDKGRVDATKRRTEVFWVEWTPELSWMFEKIANSVAIANQKWWGYHLAGLNEALQLTHYKSKDKGHYDWHEDHSDSGNFAHRKLSCVILLNEGFKGGDFELIHTGKPEELSMGTMIIFPSFRLHRVKPVTKGDRWSLVAWVSGPPFV